VGLFPFGTYIQRGKAVDFDKEFKSNMINISGILAGFLFTSILQQK